jgi:hypothetical protein
MSLRCFAILSAITLVACDGSSSEVLHSASDGGASGSDGGPGVTNGGDSGTRPNPYDPDASIDYSNYDISKDPGIDPIFATDPELNKSETYTYVFTKPGDHTFPENTCVAQFDAGGAVSLLSVLTPMKAQLASCTGFALYLTAGTSALKDADLRTLQILNKSEAEGGLAATKLVRLYVYNLKSIQGGVECLPDSGVTWPNSGANCAGTKVLGNHTYMWANGWAGGWVRDLVMDDLEEVPAGAFCNAKFYTLSMRGVRAIGKMGFGEQPHGHLRFLYLPSVTKIGEHAFRRIQVAPEVFTKINLPKVTRIDSYAFDDNTDLGYFNAPELLTIGRNVFNDTGKLISVNMPKLQSMEHACFGINTSMKAMRLPSLVTIIGDALSNMGQLRLLYLPALESLGGGALGGDGLLEALYVPSLSLVEAGALSGTTSLKKLTLPAADVTLKNAALQNATLEELSISGEKKTLQGAPFQNCGTLKTIHFGNMPPIQSTNTAFAGSSAELVGYYTGDNPSWSTFVFNGNPTAKLLKE